MGIAFRAKPIVKESAKQSLNTHGLDGILYWMGFRNGKQNLHDICYEIDEMFGCKIGVIDNLANARRPNAHPTMNRRAIITKSAKSGPADLGRLGNTSTDVNVRADKDMHHRLGCDPCPTGDLDAEYMRKK